MSLCPAAPGNPPAPDATLADIAAHGLDDMYCLGDLVGYGPNPSGVVERVRAAGIPTVRGNYDDGVGARRGRCGCYYATDQTREDVIRAAGRKANDDPHRPRRISLRPSEARPRRVCGSTRCKV